MPVNYSSGRIVDEEAVKRYADGVTDYDQLVRIVAQQAFANVTPAGLGVAGRWLAVIAVPYSPPSLRLLEITPPTAMHIKVL